jgi:hypothetical protein
MEAFLDRGSLASPGVPFGQPKLTIRPIASVRITMSAGAY